MFVHDGKLCVRIASTTRIYIKLIFYSATAAAAAVSAQSHTDIRCECVCGSVCLNSISIMQMCETRTTPRLPAKYNSTHIAWHIQNHLAIVVCICVHTVATQNATKATCIHKTNQTFAAPSPENHSLSNPVRMQMCNEFRRVFPPPLTACRTTRTHPTNRTPLHTSDGNKMRHSSNPAIPRKSGRNRRRRGGVMKYQTNNDRAWRTIAKRTHMKQWSRVVQQHTDSPHRTQ